MLNYIGKKSYFLQQESKDDEGVISTLKMIQDFICLLIGTLWNYGDHHDEFCLTCNELGMVQLFVDIVKELQDSIPHNVKYVVSIKITYNNFINVSVSYI